MSQVDLLHRLQQIDDEIRADKRRLSEVIRLQRETDELRTARKRAETAAAELKKLRAQQNELNLELGGLATKVTRSEQRLYSGLVTNPKELTDIQHEIEALGRRLEALEDELLEAMIMLEDAQVEESEASSQLQMIESTWITKQQSLKEEQDTLARRLNELAALRNQQLTHISPQSLATYELVSKRIGTLVVVPLKNGRCRGCQVKVPATLVKLADEGQLVQCDSCGRILCLE